MNSRRFPESSSPQLAGAVLALPWCCCWVAAPACPGRARRCRAGRPGPGHPGPGAMAIALAAWGGRPGAEPLVAAFRRPAAGAADRRCPARKPQHGRRRLAHRPGPGRPRGGRCGAGPAGRRHGRGQPRAAALEHPGQHHAVGRGAGELGARPVRWPGGRARRRPGPPGRRPGRLARRPGRCGRRGGQQLHRPAHLRGGGAAERARCQLSRRDRPPHRAELPRPASRPRPMPPWRAPARPRRARPCWPSRPPVPSSSRPWWP